MHLNRQALLWLLRAELRLSPYGSHLFTPVTNRRYVIKEVTVHTPSRDFVKLVTVRIAGSQARILNRVLLGRDQLMKGRWQARSAAC
jgi:hypothetical protein